MFFAAIKSDIRIGNAWLQEGLTLQILICIRFNVSKNKKRNKKVGNIRFFLGRKKNMLLMALHSI